MSNTTQSIIRNKKLLPLGKNGATFNVQYGDNSDVSSWELLGYRFTYSPLSYRPTP
jgi:hypothetical protein